MKYIQKLMTILRYMPNYIVGEWYNEVYPSWGTFRRTLANNGFQWCEGATKVCLVHPDSKYVLKFDYETYETHAPYCVLEARYYMEAKRFGVEKAVLSTEYYTTTATGIDLYIQSKYKSDFYSLCWSEICNLRSTVNPHLSEKISQKFFMPDWHPIPVDFVSILIRRYGKKFVDRLAEWTVYCQINDLHSENVGFDLRGKPVLTDYAGYRELSYFEDSSKKRG